MSEFNLESLSKWVQYSYENCLSIAEGVRRYYAGDKDKMNRALKYLTQILK